MAMCIVHVLYKFAPLRYSQSLQVWMMETIDVQKAFFASRSISGYAKNATAVRDATTRGHGLVATGLVATTQGRGTN